MSAPKTLLLLCVLCLVCVSSAFAQTFQEDWESGINPSIWNTFGNPSPLLIQGVGVGGSKAVDPNGDGWCDSGLWTVNPVPWGLGSELTFQFRTNIYGDARQVHYQVVRVALTTGDIVNDVCAADQQPTRALTFEISTESDVGQLIRMYQSGVGTYFSQPYPASEDGIWHQVSINYQSGGSFGELVLRYDGGASQVFPLTAPLPDRPLHLLITGRALFITHVFDNIAVSSGQPPTLIDISGDVTKDHYSAASRAIVHLINPDTRRVVSRVTSDADGHFVFSDIPAGRYAVSGSIDGYVTDFQNLGNLGSSKENVQLDVLSIQDPRRQVAIWVNEISDISDIRNAMNNKVFAASEIHPVVDTLGGRGAIPSDWLDETHEIREQISRRHRVLLSYSLAPGSDLSTILLSISSAAQADIVQSWVDTVIAYGADGLDLDMEGWESSAGSGQFSDFCELLGAVLHVNGKRLTIYVAGPAFEWQKKELVALPEDQQFLQYSRLAQACDVLEVSCYERNAHTPVQGTVCGENAFTWASVNDILSALEGFGIARERLFADVSAYGSSWVPNVSFVGGRPRSRDQLTGASCLVDPEQRPSGEAITNYLLSPHPVWYGPFTLGGDDYTYLWLDDSFDCLPAGSCDVNRNSFVRYPTGDTYSALEGCGE